MDSMLVSLCSARGLTFITVETLWFDIPESAYDCSDETLLLCFFLEECPLLPLEERNSDPLDPLEIEDTGEESIIPSLVT
jgi:hypothetical protein